jgi:hypothetical protein
MQPLSRWFGVTFTDTERNLDAEGACHAEIVEKVLLLQSIAAAKQQRRFAVDLTRDGTAVPADGVARQDFSLQNATTLPLNDARVFLATMKVLTASNPVRGLWSLSFHDRMSVVRALLLALSQARQTVRPYQQLRYWSTVPFRHGPVDVVMRSATPSSGNAARVLQRGNLDALKSELVRHVPACPGHPSCHLAVEVARTSRAMTWNGRARWVNVFVGSYHGTSVPRFTAPRITKAAAASPTLKVRSTEFHLVNSSSSAVGSLASIALPPRIPA